jgi:hypothetical protein
MNTNTDMNIATNDVNQQAEPALEARIAEAVRIAVRNVFETYAVVETDGDDPNEQSASDATAEQRCAAENAYVDEMGFCLDAVSEAWDGLRRVYRMYTRLMDQGSVAEDEANALSVAARELYRAASDLRHFFEEDRTNNDDAAETETIPTPYLTLNVRAFEWDALAPELRERLMEGVPSPFPSPWMAEGEADEA